MSKLELEDIKNCAEDCIYVSDDKDRDAHLTESLKQWLSSGVSMTTDKEKKRQTAIRQARSRDRHRQAGKVQIYEWLTPEEKEKLLEQLNEMRGEK